MLKIKRYSSSLNWPIYKWTTVIHTTSFVPLKLILLNVTIHSDWKVYSHFPMYETFSFLLSIWEQIISGGNFSTPTQSRSSLSLWTSASWFSERIFLQEFWWEGRFVFAWITFSELMTRSKDAVFLSGLDLAHIWIRLYSNLERDIGIQSVELNLSKVSIQMHALIHYNVCLISKQRQNTHALFIL